MRVTERMKKWISMILCLCMLAQNAPMMVFAASTNNLCDHHPKHTEDCGYVEAVAGSACTHKHSEACYKIVDCKHTCSDECGDPCTTHTCTVDDGCITMERDCHHVHGECGYAEAVEPQDCTTCQPVLVHAQNCGYVAPVAEETCDCVPGEDGTVTHIEGCGYVAPVEEEKCDCEPTVIHGGEGCTYVEGKDGSPCTHVCAVVVDSADSCYKLLCSHKDGGHDDACGYAAAVEGHACHYECSACEDNAGDDSPVPEGVCAHGNSEESCETCVGEIQVMINALPDMEDIGDHNRADVISQLEAIDDRMWKLSDAAKGKLNADKYVDAAFVLSAPEGFFGFLLTKRYEAGASAMPQASFAFLDASGVAATVITPEEQQTTSMEPVSNGGAVRGYLPVGEYTLDETVVGDWNLAMSVNGQAEGDHTFTGEGGRAYRIETVNTNKPCEHTAEMEENKATCKKQAVCDLCGNRYGAVNKNNHDASVAFDNGFCPNGCYESAKLVDGVYQISNAGQLYWFAEQVNSGNYSINGKLMEDILVNENVLNSEGIVSSGPFRKWYPIGSTEYDDEFKYSGTFNGNGKTISGLYFDNNNVDGVGLFGYVASGEIQNVGIKDSYFNGDANVGSVVAHNYQGTVTGCYNTGTVSGGNTVGGVVGQNKEGTVTDCYNSGRIGSRVNNVGGVLGGNIGTVSGCYNTGSISGQDCVGGVAGYSGGKVSNCYNTGEVDGNKKVGGVLGLNESGSTLSNCYNTGEVNGDEMIGGVLGFNQEGSTLINCYNTGEVSDGFYIGGVLGRNGRGSILINCYNTGKVSGGLSVGGVAGENDQGTISNCYYLTGTDNGGINGADVAGKAEAKTMKQFASGEVAYLLREPFGQNIDNGQPKQEIPCFSNAIVYAVKNCKEKTVYSNTNENIGHEWNGSVCSICGNSCSHSIDNTTGKCSACGAREIFFEANVSWNKVCAYYWDNINQVKPVTWPGVELTKNADGIYHLIVPGDTTHIIFNDGNNNGNQTEDLELGVENCYHYDGYNGYWYTYPCTEHSWGEDGKCSNCQKACPHNTFDPNTGKCSDCETNIAVASVKIGGTTTKFKTLAGAVDAAKDGTAEAPATLTLLKNINLGESYQQIDSGVLTLDLNGCKLAGTSDSVLKISGNETSKPDVTITDSKGGGTITNTGTSTTYYCIGVRVISGGIVTINGGTISATEYGVYAYNSTVKISGGEISGNGERSVGVDASVNSNVTISGGTITGTNYGVGADNSTVTISGGTITGTYYGVQAYSNSTVTISGGEVSSTDTYSHGVYANNSTVTISGGTITGRDYGVYAYSNSTVTITGGTITGGNYDLKVDNNGSITLGLVEGATKGATFPGGLTVDGTTLDAILRGGAAYWQGTQMIFPSDGQKEITGGDVTVKAPCEHTTVTYSVKDVTDATKHKVACSCGYENLEDHTFDSTTGECQYCETKMAVAKVEIGENTTYFETLANAVTEAKTGTAEAPATLTLLKNINLGTSSQEINSGVMTLDLNGCTLTCSGAYVLYIRKIETHVTITDGSKAGTGTISGTGTGTTTSSGCQGVRVYLSTLTIKNGTISGTSDGVFVRDGDLSVAGGTVSGDVCGVKTWGTVAEISGGTITATGEGSVGVQAEESSIVTISGGTITGGTYDLKVVDTGSIITLGLGKDGTGATFPDGLNVTGAPGTTLKAILGEGAAYWKDGKMLTDIADDATVITGGDVTVKVECKHKNATYQQITDTQHTLVCSECLYSVTENHTLTYTASGNVITESCSECKATLGTATITANDKTYNGDPVTAAVQKTGVLTDSNIGITYSQNGEELNESAIRAGTYTASIKLGDAVAKVNFTITPATLPNAVLSETGYTYNGQQQKPDVTVTGLTENTDYTVTYPQDVTNAGEKTVTITGKGNYTGTVTKSYSIAKADSVVTKAPQAAANLVYNGKNQNLVSAGTVTGGTLRYSLDGKTWTATIPVGKAAGTYTVSYKVVGDGNHKDIAVQTLAVTIAKGTAPAVDALVQTHFYAYATANTVDLAKYLPADRGTTAYTAIGVSADIFSSVLTVTNAGVLSYTTRKLTAAPASDTQIRIRAVMENYADAELTVTVKLLAVTEQTQQKIVKTELTEVPAGLAGTRFHSVDAIKTEQTRVLGSLLGYDPQGNILHYDVKLQFSPDGGKTWVDATEENFPANGLTVTLPYPSGTGKDTHNFVVSHMFTTGAKAGTTETPAVTKTAEGIRFTVTGLSPVSVACSAIPFDVKVANVTNGTVYVSSAQATAGTQVTITATPKSGYRLSSLAVKDAAGNSYTVSTDNNGKYYFIMPAVDVTVTATFTAKSTAVADTTNPKTGDDFPILFWSGMMMTTLLGAAALMLNKQKFYER